jgi:hypothetical protein
MTWGRDTLLWRVRAKFDPNDLGTDAVWRECNQDQPEGAGFGGAQTSFAKQSFEAAGCACRVGPVDQSDREMQRLSRRTGSRR